MADDLTPEQRRRNMQAIKSKDTTIELALRKALWGKGIRYRKNYKMLIGKPDIAITKYKLAVFCDSIPKIERNMARDEEINATLEAEGWTVIRFWKRQIRKELDKCVDEVMKIIIIKNNKLI